MTTRTASSSAGSVRRIGSHRTHDDQRIMTIDPLLLGAVALAAFFAGAVAVAALTIWGRWRAEQGAR